MTRLSSMGPGALRALLLGSVAFGLATPVQAAGTVEDLERQLETLTREIQEMKAAQEQQQQRIEAQEEEITRQQEQIETAPVTPAPAQAVTGGDQPGSFRLPGTDTSVKIGGYVKGDLIYDVDSDAGDSFAVSAIPADGPDNEEGSFRAHARQTRLNVTTWTPTEFGELKTLIEGDFFGGGGNETISNSTSFRLRHAYGQWGPLLVGQTWTLFMPLASYPETVDFAGPAGVPFIRQGQLRFTQEVSDNLTIAASAENSELSARRASGSISSERDDTGVKFGIDTIPDFVVAGEYRTDGMYFKLAGLGRLLEIDPAGPGDDSTFAWGVHAGAAIDTFGDDSVQLNFTYGDGIGRYIINGVGNDAFVDAGDNLDTIESWGVAAGYTHHWTDTWRSNLVYGHYEADTFAPGDTDSLDTIHANLFWSPIDRVNLGFEAIYGQRNFQSSSLDNDALRFQFGAQYTF